MSQGAKERQQWAAAIVLGEQVAQVWGGWQSYIPVACDMGYDVAFTDEDRGVPLPWDRRRRLIMARPQAVTVNETAMMSDDHPLVQLSRTRRAADPRAV